MNNDSLIQYLKQNGIQSLIDEFKVNAKRHGTYNNLVLLKYDQIETPRNEVTNQCRGCVINETTMEYVARPYDRFFNYGEGHAANINWARAKCYNKLDGSLTNVYNYNGEWHVSTSGMPDANGPVNLGSITFRELFWNLWNQLGYRLPNNTDLTYCFELMTPQNRVIVPVNQSRIVLHGVRCKQTGMEFDPESIANDMGWEVVESFPLYTIDDIVAAAANINPMEQEGYVVVDNEFRRIKVKSPQYVALAHIKDSMSERRMVEIIRTNEASEFLAFFKEYQALYDALKKPYDALVMKLEASWNQNCDTEGQKEFALKVKDQPFSSILFGLRNKKIQSVREGLKETNIRYLTEHLMQGIDINEVMGFCTLTKEEIAEAFA